MKKLSQEPKDKLRMGSLVIVNFLSDLRTRQ